jgi:hypothetical protein
VVFKIGGLKLQKIENRGTKNVFKLKIYKRQAKVTLIFCLIELNIYKITHLNNFKLV